MKKQHPHEHLKTRELTILELRASFFPWLSHKQNTPSKKHEDCEKKEENPYFLGGGGPKMNPQIANSHAPLESPPPPPPPHYQLKKEPHHVLSLNNTIVHSTEQGKWRCEEGEVVHLAHPQHTPTQMGTQMTKKTKDIYTKSGNEVAQSDAKCQLLLSSHRLHCTAISCQST